MRQKASKKCPLDEALKLAKLSETAIAHELVIALKHAGIGPRRGKKAGARLTIIEEFWQAIQYELRELLCDCNQEKPKPWVEELITGEVRNLVVALMAILVSSYDMPISIAIPITALIVKRQLIKLCSTPVPRPERGVKEILLAKQESFSSRRKTRKR